MQIVDAIKNLTIAMKGSGSVEEITTDQIADAILTNLKAAGIMA